MSFLRTSSLVYILQLCVLFLYPVNRVNIDIGFRVVPIYFLLPLVIFTILLLKLYNIKKMQSIEFVFFFFYIFTLTTTLYSFSYEESFRYVMGLSLVTFTYFICRSIMLYGPFDISKQLRTVGKLFVILSLLNYVIGLFTMNVLAEHVDFYGVTIEKGIPRMLGLNNDPNICAFANLVFFYYFMFDYKKYSKIFMGLAFLGILLTLSRGGMISLVLGLLSCFIILSGKQKVRFFIYFLFALFFLVLLVYVNYELLEPFISKRVSGLETGAGRFEIWGNAIELFYNKPLLGYGIFTFRDVSGALFGDPRHAHNTYLEVLVETGLLGLLIFLTVLCFILLFSYRLAKKSDKCKFLFPSVASVFVAISGLSMYINLTFWYLLLLNILFYFNEKKIEK